MIGFLRLGKFLPAAVAAATLIGCTVGPDFRRPEAPETKAYTATLPDATATATVPGGEAQRFATGRDIPAEWWRLFESEPLDEVIRRALAESPPLAAAQARLREAYEERRAGAGALFPQFDANVSAARQKISGAAFGQPGVSFGPFNLYNASVSVSYALDLFGGTRRELEALQSQVDYQRFQVEGAYLALTSNIVTTAVKEASLRAQIRVTREILEVQRKLLTLIERQFELGSVSRADVFSQRTQLAQTEATLPPLEKELKETRRQLAVLAGRIPGDEPLPEFDLEGLHLPQELPVSLPSSLVRQRPDILASEALLHAASAQVGVATANLYPQITLTGLYGYQAGATPTDLFKSGTSMWSIGAGLLQPVFHGGALTAKRRAAVAAYDQAEAQYHETVLQAFRNVGDVLGALDADAHTLNAQADAAASAHDTFDLTESQFRLGAVSYLSLLNAERQYLQTRINLVQAQALRFADTAALFQALGGGWWNHSEPDDSAAMTDSERSSQ